MHAHITLVHGGLVTNVWGRGTPKYGLRGDSTSLATLSYEGLPLKTSVKIQVLLIYLEN